MISNIRYFKLIVFLILLHPIFVHASQIENNLADRSNSFSRNITTQFYKGLDVNGWRGIFNYSVSIDSSRWIFHLDEDLDVKQYNIPGFQRQWKYDQQLSINLRQMSQEGLSFIALGQANRFYDQDTRSKDKTVFPQTRLPEMVDYQLIPDLSPGKILSDVQFSHLSFGAVWNYTDNTRLCAAAGPLREVRYNSRSDGLRLSVDASGEWDVGEISFDGSLDRLSNGSDKFIKSGISHRFGSTEEVYDEFDITFNTSEQREYPFIQDRLGERTDEQLKIANNLSSAESADFRLYWDSEFSRRKTGHRSDTTSYADREFTWENEIALQWETERIKLETKGGADLQDQEYNFTLTQGRRIYLGFNTGFLIGRRDSTTFDARVIKYRFDTPDTSDYNDRDELRYLFSLSGLHRFSQTFGIRAILETDLHHLVYLYSQRSGENRWQRRFSLTFELPWVEEVIYNNASFSVMANYTSYDFPPSDTDLSRSYRSFTALDTLEFDIYKDLNIELDLSFLLDEHGRFSWEDWITDISEDGYSYSAVLSPEWQSGNSTIKAGWSVYGRRSWTYESDSTRVPWEDILTTGPIVDISTELADNLELKLRGSILQVRDRIRSNYRLPNVRCKLTYWI